MIRDLWPVCTDDSEAIEKFAAWPVHEQIGRIAIRRAQRLDAILKGALVDPADFKAIVAHLGDRCVIRDKVLVVDTPAGRIVIIAQPVARPAQAMCERGHLGPVGARCAQCVFNGVALEAICETTVADLKHGPGGAGGPGPCDPDCRKCALERDGGVL